MRELGKKILNALKSMGLFLAAKAYENMWALIIGGGLGYMLKGIIG